MCSMCVYIYILGNIYNKNKRKSPLRNCGNTDLLQPGLSITINLYYGLTIIHIENFEQELCIFENKITQKYLFIRFVETVFFYRVSPSCFSKKSPLYISFLPFIFLLLLLHSYHFLHLTCFLLQHKFRHELSLYSWAVPLGSSSLNIMIN